MKRVIKHGATLLLIMLVPFVAAAQDLKWSEVTREGSLVCVGSGSGAFNWGMNYDVVHHCPEKRAQALAYIFFQNLISSELINLRGTRQGVSAAHRGELRAEGHERAGLHSGSGKLSSKSERVVGHIFTAPDSQKRCFTLKDLVYIKLNQSSENIVQVGDRYGVKSEVRLGDDFACFDPLCSEDRTWAGELEIICVGEDVALGIIIKANSLISKGLSVNRVNRPLSVPLSSRAKSREYADQSSNF